MLRASFPLASMSSFQASMPDRYREAFDARAIREHAAIVARRAGAPVHAEIWQRLPRGGGAIVCVVADDRPGLLALISASLVAHQMDVVAAHAYTRIDPETGRGEAVDFLWLQRDASLPMPVRQGDVTRIADMLRALVLGETTIEKVIRRVRAPRPAPPGASTRVMFDGGTDDGGLVVLTVETFDRPGLLLTVTQALHRAGVQIVATDASTRAGRVIDRFTIAELDGTPIRAPRRGMVQMEVLSAVEALARGLA
jgi:[protein-PII] uridylyltransferase